MSIRWFRLIGVASAVATPVSASITMSIDVLDGSDPGAPSPAGMVVVDVGVDVSADDWFFNAAIVGRMFNGATLEYGLYPDPNFPVPTFHPPGLDNRYVSFGSAAFGRNDPPRFAPAGTVAEQTIEFYGDLPQPILLPDQLSIAFYAAPYASSNDPDTPRGRDGYVARIAFDITGVNLPGAADPANYRIFTLGQAPAGYEPVFVSEPVKIPYGTYVSSNYQPNGTYRNWGLYVPEPNSLGALVFGAVILSRRRRRGT